MNETLKPGDTINCKLEDLPSAARGFKAISWFGVVVDVFGVEVKIHFSDGKEPLTIHKREDSYLKYAHMLDDQETIEALLCQPAVTPEFIQALRTHRWKE